VTEAMTTPAAPLTAVQLRQDQDLVCRVVHGQPAESVGGGQGPIALYPPGRLVAYQVDSRFSTRLYVFRTLAAPSPAAALVPGVHPAVDLLLETRTPGATAKACNLFSFVSKKGYEVDTISDAFWLRVAGVLAGRRRGRTPRLPALLEREAR
jgi:hypothetical protein